MESISKTNGSGCATTRKTGTFLTYKKFLAMAFCLCAVAFSSKMMAQFPSGSGTASSPYIITNATHLDNVRNNLTAYYKLGNDITLSGNWTPIGTSSNPFKGNFDGNKKVIRGLAINNRTIEYSGLFGYVTNGTVENLGIEDADIYYSDSYDNRNKNSGVVVGFNNNGTVKNCYSTGTISARANTNGGVLPGSTTHYSRVGGVVGRNDGSNAKVENCYSTCTVTSTGNAVGVGVNNAHCYAGGIVGENINSGKVSNCYSIGTVTATRTNSGNT